MIHGPDRQRLLPVRSVALTNIVMLALLSLLLVGRPLPAQAQTPEQLDAFVFGINASVPGAVIGTFAPPNVDSIYFLADHTSILSPRRTRVYFWPITNEYRAAWSEVNEQVDGALEVLQGGRVIAELQQETYTIHFSSGEGAPRPQLYIGQEAVEANEDFQAAQNAYRQAVLDYQQAREAWLAQARDAQARGIDRSTLPPAPQAPEAFNLFSTGLNQGYPVDLPSGTYQIRTRAPGGDIIPESERRLVVFEPRRTAIGYEVIPEARWTFSEELNDLASAILAEPHSVIYLNPYIVREYPTLAYEHLQNPQYTGDASGSEWMWVSGESVASLTEDAQLEVVRQGRLEDRISLQPYFVRQVPGGELGYDILPYSPETPDLTPRVDFSGYRLELSPERSAFEVRLRSPEQEQLLGSAREVRVVQPVSVYSLLPIALLPLALGGMLLFWRRRQTESGKFN